MASHDQNKSEVARLLKQIADGYEAARLGAQGIAATARHEFVRKRMQQGVEQPFEQLITLVGSPEEAIALVADALKDIPQPVKEDAQAE